MYICIYIYIPIFFRTNMKNFFTFNRLVFQMMQDFLGAYKRNCFLKKYFKNSQKYFLDCCSVF